MSHLAATNLSPGSQADMHAQWAGQVILALSAGIHRYSTHFACSKEETANNNL